MMADALSRKGNGLLAHLMVFEWNSRKAMQQLQIQEDNSGKYIVSLRVQPTLVQKISEGQMVDTEIQTIQKGVEQGTMKEFSVQSDGLLRFRTRMCVPNDSSIWEEVLSS